MAKLKILEEGANYTFRSYFELPNDTNEILAEFGHTFRATRLQLPRTPRQLEQLTQLQQQLETDLQFVRLSSETAKREILVAPIMIRVAVICQQILRIEYPLKVNHQLQGNLDYLIRANHSLVVVEAKHDDMTRGFTQLAVEMIALSMLEDSPKTIYRAVTIGNIWTFGRLDSATRTITQDIASYAVPDDLVQLIQILVGILEG